MREGVLSIWQEALPILRSHLGRIFTIHLVYVALGFAVFAPLARAVGQFLLTLLLILALSPDCRAETEAAFNPTLDKLERQLEMGRHEQLIAVRSQPGVSLAEFSTDGCSGGLSVGWEYLASRIPHFHEIHGDLPPWQSCCVTHDQDYHTGGTRKDTAAMSFETRKKADLILESCVRESGRDRAPELMEAYSVSGKELEHLFTTIAAMMYRAVRIGGMPCTGLPWRWGYGWPDCHSFKD